jgi:hypothetical protein
MKTFLAVLAVVLLLVGPAAAIPQTVGAGFVGAVGMAFEQYAAAVATWAPDAELKGPWHRRGTEPDIAGAVVTYDLAVDATVFGVPAAQVSAERKDGMVLRFTVRFDESKSRNGKTRTVALLDQVLANITALAGDAKSVSPSGERTFRHEASLITTRKSDRKGVIVEFTPAR